MKVLLNEKTILLWAKKKTIERIAIAELGSKEYDKALKYYKEICIQLKKFI